MNIFPPISFSEMFVQGWALLDASVSEPERLVRDLKLQPLPRNCYLYRLRGKGMLLSSLL